MDTNALPTKRNLLQAKHNLTLARKGHNLLDMRHKALLHELSNIKNKARLLREKLRKEIIDAYHVLAIAQMEIGKENVAKYWKNNLSYELVNTNASFDEALLTWKEIAKKLEELIKIESAIRRITHHIHRTRKRASALRNITIPLYETRVKYILEQLEERERDEQIRIKTAKKRGK